MMEIPELLKHQNSGGHCDMCAQKIFAFARPVFSRNYPLVLGTLRHLCCAMVFLLTAACFPSLANAQQETKPFIEPAEMAHERAAVRAFVETSPHINGKWQTLPFMMPINPVHVALMHNGKVLVISGSGNDPTNKIL